MARAYIYISRPFFNAYSTSSRTYSTVGTLSYEIRECMRRQKPKKVSPPLIAFFDSFCVHIFRFHHGVCPYMARERVPTEFPIPREHAGTTQISSSLSCFLPAYVLFPCFRVLSVCFSNAFCVRVPYLRSHRRCSVETMLFCRKKICGYKVVAGKEFANKKSLFQLFHQKVYSSKVLTACGEFHPHLPRL